MAGQETTQLAMLYIFAMCGPYTWDDEMRSAQEVEIKKKIDSKNRRRLQWSYTDCLNTIAFLGMKK